MTRRKVVHIDESRCDGCGLCASACAEGAIEIIDGKARLVSEVYCDGLGACLGECPQGAITIEERDAAEFDDEATKRRLEAVAKPAGKPAPKFAHGHACPSAMARTFEKKAPSPAATACEDAPSELSNWPVKIILAPVQAPWLRDAKLVIAADCVPFAFAGFHARFLAGRQLLSGCPKFGEVEVYLEKLTQVFSQNDIREIEVIYMEVPCCFALVRIVEEAVRGSRRPIPTTLTKIGLRGEVLESRKL